jgi:hypothetical protein
MFWFAADLLNLGQFVLKRKDWHFALGCLGLGQKVGIYTLFTKKKKKKKLLSFEMAFMAEQARKSKLIYSYIRFLNAPYLCLPRNIKNKKIKAENEMASDQRHLSFFFFLNGEILLKKEHYSQVQRLALICLSF